MKADRTRLVEEVAKIEKAYKPRLDAIGKKNLQLSDTATELKKQMIQVEQSAQQTTLRVLTKYMKDKNDLEQLQKEDPHQLEQGTPAAIYNALGKKVDKHEIQKMQESKANKSEIKTIVGQISVVQKEITHIMVLMNESLKLHLNKAQDHVFAKENRVLELVSQLKAVVQWSQRYQAAEKQRKKGNTTEIPREPDLFPQANM